MQTRIDECSNYTCMVDTLVSRGIEHQQSTCEEIDGPFFAGRPIVSFRVDGVPYYFDGRLRIASPDGGPRPLIDDHATYLFARQKPLVKEFLAKQGFSVPEGAAFTREELGNAGRYFAVALASHPAGLCLKPADSSGGRDVHLGVRSLASFQDAFSEIGVRCGRILIEETVPGQGHRFLCIGGRAVAIVEWRRTNVEGDGVHTVAELVERKNAERLLNPAYRNYPLRLGKQERDYLRQAGIEKNHVPKAGQIVFLKPPPNEDECTDVTNRVHPTYVSLIERALGLLPGLIVCGVDVMIEDPSLPATAKNYSILELNTPPRLVDHHYPWRGSSRNVCGAIIDFLRESSHPAIIRAALSGAIAGTR